MQTRQALMALAMVGTMSLLAGCQRDAPMNEAVAQQPSPPASPASSTPSFPPASGPASSPPSSPIR